MAIGMEIVKNILCFLIMISLIHTMMEKSAFAKYVQFFMGIIFIVVVFEPLTSLLHRKIDFTTLLDVSIMESDRKEMEQVLSMADESYEEEVVKQYEQVIGKQIEAMYGCEVEKTVIEYDEEKKNIESLHIILDEKKKIDKEKIGISQITIGGEEEILKKGIEEYYGLEENKVTLE